MSSPIISTSPWKQNAFRDIFTDAYLFLHFRSFLEPMLCVENLSFYLEVEEYKTILDAEIRHIRAHAIYDKFLKMNSRHEINIEAIVRADILSKLENPGEDIFNDIQTTVQLCLETELYPKFLQSDQYRSYRIKAETHLNGSRSSPRESALKKRFTLFFTSRKGSSESTTSRSSTEGISKIIDKELTDKEISPEKDKHPQDKKDKRNTKQKTNSVPKIMKNLLTKDSENINSINKTRSKDKLQDSVDLETTRDSEFDSWDAYSVSSATNKSSDFSSWREKSLDSTKPTVSELEKQILESLLVQQSTTSEEPEFIQF